MRSINKTIKRLATTYEILEELEFQIEKVCSEINIILQDITNDLDFTELMEAGKLKGGKDSLPTAFSTLEEAKNDATFRLSELGTRILVLERALESLKSAADRD